MERWRRGIHDEDVWCEIKPRPGSDDDARPYYYNESTRVSSWALPTGVRPKATLGPDTVRPAQPTVFAVGTHVWVPDDVFIVSTGVVEGEAFAPGQEGTIRMDPISPKGGGDRVGRQRKLSAQATARVRKFDEQLLKPQIDDLITLDTLSEHAILHKLRLRYAGVGSHAQGGSTQDAQGSGTNSCDMYTNVSSVLVSVNPCKPLPIFGDDTLQCYLSEALSSTSARRMAQGETDLEQEWGPKTTTTVSSRDHGRPQPPHAFQVAARAYAGMLVTGVPQSMLVTGESGAGKTEATKLILRFLAEASRVSRVDTATLASDVSDMTGTGRVDQELERKIVSSSPLLEAFGNAQTVRNDNSSRFGKLVTVEFTEKGCVRGAFIDNYLLEKSRVVHQAQGERNYHIFYQLLAAIHGLDQSDFSVGDEETSGADEAKGNTGVVEHKMVAAVAKALAPGTDAGAHLLQFRYMQGGAGVVAKAKLDGVVAARSANASSFKPTYGDTSKQSSKPNTSNTSRLISHSSSDAAEFREVMSTLTVLGVSDREQRQALEVLAAILALGELHFVTQTGADGSQHTAVTEDASAVPTAPAAVARKIDESGNDEMGENGDSERVGFGLGRAAALVGVEPRLLERALCFRRHAGGRGSVYDVPYSAEQAADNRDAMVKSLYSGLFDWLVAKINKSLALSMSHVRGISLEASMSRGRALSAAPAAEPVIEEQAQALPQSSQTFVVSVLDIFGFESFESNSFEQLCINYCNEKLHYFFNKHIFTLEQEEYRRQGIDVPIVNFDDNQPCVELIDAPRVGLLAMIDDEIRIAGGSDQGLLSKVKQLLPGGSRHGGAAPRASEGRTSDNQPMRSGLTPTDPRVLNSHRCFSIAHFAGIVAYDVEHFLDKNKDNVPEQISEMLRCSTCPLVTAAVDCAGASHSSDGPGHKHKTLGSMFKRQMSALYERLDATTPYFVRCIKPNDALEPGRFDAPKVLLQLRCNGLLDVCRIRQVGFPVRLSHEDFLHRYRALLPAPADSGDNNATQLENLLSYLQECAALKARQWARGASKIFLRARASFDLDHWPEIVARAHATLYPFVLCAIARTRYQSYLVSLRELQRQLKLRSLKGTKTMIDACNRGWPSDQKFVLNGAGDSAQVDGTAVGSQKLSYRALPAGWRRHSVAILAEQMLPQLQLEAEARQACIEAARSRDKDAIESALERVASISSSDVPHSIDAATVLEASHEVTTARRVLALLDRIAKTRLQLGRVLASQPPHHGNIRSLLIEAETCELDAPLRDDSDNFSSDEKSASGKPRYETDTPDAAEKRGACVEYVQALQFLRRVVDVEHKLVSLSAPFEGTPNYETDARASTWEEDDDDEDEAIGSNIHDTNEINCVHGVDASNEDVSLDLLQLEEVITQALHLGLCVPNPTGTGIDEALHPSTALARACIARDTSQTAIAALNDALHPDNVAPDPQVVARAVSACHRAGIRSAAQVPALHDATVLAEQVNKMKQRLLDATHSGDSIQIAEAIKEAQALRLPTSCTAYKTAIVAQRRVVELKEQLIAASSTRNRVRLESLLKEVSKLGLHDMPEAIDACSILLRMELQSATAAARHADRARLSPEGNDSGVAESSRQNTVAEAKALEQTDGSTDLNNVQHHAGTGVDIGRAIAELKQLLLRAEAGRAWHLQYQDGISANGKSDGASPSAQVNSTTPSHSEPKQRSRQHNSPMPLLPVDDEVIVAATRCRDELDLGMRIRAALAVMEAGETSVTGDNVTDPNSGRHQAAQTQHHALVALAALHADAVRLGLTELPEVVRAAGSLAVLEAENEVMAKLRPAVAGRKLAALAECLLTLENDTAAAEAEIAARKPASSNTAESDAGGRYSRDRTRSRMGTRTRFASVVSRKHSSSAMPPAGLKRTVSQRLPTTKEAARREALLALAHHPEVIEARRLYAQLLAAASGEGQGTAASITPAIQGWMWKLGQRGGKSFKRRWMELRGSVLLYYSRPPERTSTEQNTGVGNDGDDNMRSGELTRERRQRWLSKTRGAGICSGLWACCRRKASGLRGSIDLNEVRRVVRLSEVQRRWSDTEHIDVQADEYRSGEVDDEDESKAVVAKSTAMSNDNVDDAALTLHLVTPRRVWVLKAASIEQAHDWAEALRAAALAAQITSEFGRTGDGKTITVKQGNHRESRIWTRGALVLGLMRPRSKSEWLTPGTQLRAEHNNTVHTEREVVNAPAKSVAGPHASSFVPGDTRWSKPRLIDTLGDMASRTKISALMQAELVRVSHEARAWHVREAIKARIERSRQRTERKLRSIDMDTSTEQKLGTTSTVTSQASVAGSDTRDISGTIKISVSGVQAGADSKEPHFVQGTLHTGPVLVKQDFAAFGLLFKAVEWQPMHFALGTHALYAFASTTSADDSPAGTDEGDTTSGDKRDHTWNPVGWVMLTPDTLVFPSNVCAFAIQIVTPYLVANVVAETENSFCTWLGALRDAVSAIAVRPGARAAAASSTIPPRVLLAAKHVAVADGAAGTEDGLHEQDATGDRAAIYSIELEPGQSVGIKFKACGQHANWAIVKAAKAGSGVEVGSALLRVGGRAVSEYEHGYHTVAALLSRGWGDSSLKLEFRRPLRGGGFLVEHKASGERRVRYCALECGVFTMRTTVSPKAKKRNRHDKKLLSVASDRGAVLQPASLKAFVDLNGASLRMLHRSELKHSDDHCFQLTSGAIGFLTFQAENEAMLSRWVSALFVAISMANDGGFVRASLGLIHQTQRHSNADASNSLANLAPAPADVPAPADDDTGWMRALAELQEAENLAHAQARARAIELLSSDSAGHSAVVIEGTLNKYSLAIRQRKRVRNWKRRYVVLTREGAVPAIAYYTDATKHRQKGTVELFDHTRVTPSTQRQFAFTVADHTVELVLQASCEEERVAWMKALEDVINREREKRQEQEKRGQQQRSHHTQKHSVSHSVTQSQAAAAAPHHLLPEQEHALTKTRARAQSGAKSRRARTRGRSTSAQGGNGAPEVNSNLGSHVAI